MEGAAGDPLTLDDGRAVVIAEDRLQVMLDAKRTVRSISANREIASLQDLVGRPSIDGLRGAIAEALSGEAAAGAPYTRSSAPSLVHLDDPLGWHALPPGRGMDHCRYRRIDAWIEHDLIRVDSMTQDSAAAPDDAREAAHECALQATTDARRESRSRSTPGRTSCRIANVPAPSAICSESSAHR